MATAKPAVKPQAKPAPVEETVAEDVKPDAKIKVKNITDRSLSLSCGVLKSEKEGSVTLAEASTLHMYLERV